MEILDALAKLAERDPLSVMTALFVLAFWLSQRNAERDDKNVGAALTLTTTMATAFTQFGDAMQQHGRTMEKIGATMGEMMNIVHSGQEERAVLTSKLDQGTATMAEVTARRDLEAQQDREAHKVLHQDIVDRLGALQMRMDNIARNITGLTDFPTMRQETAKLLLLAAEISNNVKKLIPDYEPGEIAPQPPEPSIEKSESEPKEQDNG